MKEKKRQSPSKGRIVFRGPFFVLRERPGTVSGEKTKKWIVLEHPGAAAAVPVLPGGKIVLVRQYRPAIGKRTLEIPAGKLEPGESAESCLQRELAEETGRRAGRLEHLASFHPSFGISDEIIHIFLASGLTEAKAETGDEGRIETVILPLPKIERLIAAGEITDAKTIIGVAAARDRLKD